MLQKRLQSLDMLKGLCILCITLLHYEDGIFPDWVNCWIGNFMITAFYFASGWQMGMKKERPLVKPLFKKLIHSLAIPYMYFAILIILFDVILASFGLMEWRRCLVELYEAITLRGIGTLWFLPVLFFGELLFVFLLNLNKPYYMALLLLFGCIYFNYYTPWSAVNRDLSTLNQIIDSPLRSIYCILIAWPIIGIGYYVAKRYILQFIQLSNSKAFIIGITLSVFFIWLSSFSNVSFGGFTTLVNAIIASLGWLFIFKSLERARIMKFFSYWGRNSLVLMVTHYSFLLVICRLINEKIFDNPQFLGYITLVYFGISIIIEYLIVWLINNKMPFLIGKK